MQKLEEELSKLRGDKNFDQVLKEASWAVRSATRKIENVINRRGRLKRDYYGLSLVRDVQALVKSLVELEQIIKGGNE